MTTNRTRFVRWILPVAGAVIFAVAILGVIAIRESNADKRLAQIPAGFHVHPVDGLHPDFIMGADVSMLREIERNGGKFYVNGVERDCLQILKDHGVNWVRLRLWVDPTDEHGNSLGGGNNDLQTTIEIASRAKKLGMKVLIDFHYSDWWADPGKQTKPRAWQNLRPEELQQAVYEYTAGVIRALVEARARPDMVQLGNEINGGMLWPDGKIWQEGNETIGGFDGLAALLNQGIRAVRENDPYAANPEKRIKIMIHLANGGRNDIYRTMFDGLTERGVEYDVIGLSYYSYWHGPLADLVNNMNDISVRYNKPVIVAETAYPFTVEAGDAHPNLFGDGLQELGGYQATVQGQATAIRDVIAAVAQVPGGRGWGIFYWEPDWIPVAGAGWKTGEGNPWENQALFDFQGNALPSLNVFHLVRPGKGKETIPPSIVELFPLTIKVPLGGPLEPPATVKALFSDDSIRQVAVQWQPFNPKFLEHPGTFTLRGSVDGSDLQAMATVTVSSVINYVTNAGFESGDLTGWTLEGDTQAVDVSNEAQNVYQDTYALHYWWGEPFQFTLSQTITGLKDGAYSLSLWIQGGGGEKILRLFARDCGGEPKTLDIVNTGWRNWSNPTITGIQVVGGSCTIGLTLESDGGSWAFLDEVLFTHER